MTDLKHASDRQAKIAGGSNPAVDLASALATLHESEAGCLLAAYGDVEAGLVLRAAPAGARPQEALDELCAQARDGYALAAHLTDTSATEPDTDIAPVIALAPGELRVFLRAADTAAADEALMLVCDDLSTANRLTSEAMALLCTLAEGDTDQKGAV